MIALAAVAVITAVAGAFEIPKQPWVGLAKLVRVEAEQPHQAIENAHARAARGMGRTDRSTSLQKTRRARRIETPQYAGQCKQLPRVGKQPSDPARHRHFCRVGSIFSHRVLHVSQWSKARMAPSNFDPAQTWPQPPTGMVR